MNNKKKATVKDIAREAGVSIATVSYIMNNRTDVKISDQTRKKVLQIANLLNYTPSLATGKTNKIGIAYRHDMTRPATSLQTASFIYLLMERLERMHYDIQFIPTDFEDDSSVLAPTHVDGIIAIDLSEKVFNRLSDSYLVPIISVDMIIDDPLFYQVYSDIPDAILRCMEKEKDSVVVTEPFANENYSYFIKNVIPSDRFITVLSMDEKTLKSLAGKKVIVIGAYLAQMLRPYVKEKDMTVIASGDSLGLIGGKCDIIEIDTSRKANMSINLLLNAMDHNFVVEHKHCLAPVYKD